MSRLVPAAAVAASLCWLNRQPGLPDTEGVRMAAVQRHTTTCGWCDYDLPTLIRLVEDAMHDDLAVKRFERESRSEQRRLVDLAQGTGILA